MQLREAIVQVQEMGLERGFTIVVVGGGMIRLIGKKTTISRIDTDKRLIALKNAENPSTKRLEDPATTVDIDCIAFSNEKDPFTKEVQKAFGDLKKALKTLRQPGFPAVSLEPVLYHPYFPKPSPLTQFVSSIESYHDNDFFFRLGAAKQDVSKKSLAFWTYEFDTTDEQIISLNPLALQRRYAIRGFSIKPKDKEKIFGKNSIYSTFVDLFNHKTDNKYEKDYLEWDQFAATIQTAQQPSMKTKKVLWNAYWNTIGTYLAHGTGVVGKILLPLGNTFFAGK